MLVIGQSQCLSHATPSFSSLKLYNLNGIKGGEYNKHVIEDQLL